MARSALFLLALAVPLFLRTSPYWLFVLTVAGLYLMVAQGLNLQTGTAGLVNFAGAALYGTGAYTAALLGTRLGWPGFPNLLLGALFALEVSALLFVPVLKVRGHYLGLVTIAFGIVFHIALNNTEAVGGSQGIKNVPPLALPGSDFNKATTLAGLGQFHFYANYYVLTVVLVALVLLLVGRLHNSPVGMLLNSIRDDEWAAKTAGVSPVPWKLLAFCLGGALMGVAGGVYAHLVGYIAPGDFTFSDSLFLISMVILGGMDSVPGVSVAALVLVLLTEKLRVIQEYRFLIYGLVVVAALIFRPQGLIPAAVRRYFPGLAAPERGKAA